MKKIAVFYHCYLVNNWEYIVDSQISKLINSGLYDDTDIIHCKVISNEQSYSKFLSKIQNHNKFISERIPTNVHEYHSVTCLYNFCKENPEHYVLYFNTKGVTRPNNEPDTDWRNMADYIHIERYKRCVDLLNYSDYNVCGAELGYTITNKGNDWIWDSYIGNYWWAKATYINTLQPPILTPDRALYETWLFHENRNWRKDRETDKLIDNKHINPYCFYKSIISLTESRTPRQLYDENFISKQEEIKTYESCVINRLNYLYQVQHKFGKNLSDKISKHYHNNHPNYIFKKYNYPM